MANMENYNCMSPTYGFFHRIFWKSVCLAATIFTTILVINLYSIFVTNPTITTLENSSSLVSTVSFPGIAVCNLNKISKRRAEKLAHHLALVTGDNYTTFLKYIRFIGQLHDFDYHPQSVEKLLEFQKTLDKAGYKLVNLIKDLAIPCKDMLEECVWSRTRRKCSEIFQMRLTHEGYCCSFNYIKETSEMVEVPKVSYSTVAGIENGLRIVIRNNLDDFFYSILSSSGITLQIFPSTDYPDKASGNLNELLIPANTENFIEIRPTTVRAVDDVISYPVEKRYCLFDKERANPFGGKYSYGDCIVGCRVESSLALCQCVSFKIPVRNVSSVCTLEDIPCLNRYRDKWFTLTPTDEVQEYLSRELHDSLRCSERCYPSCSGTFYDAQINTFPIANKTENNVTIAYIYYGRRIFNSYKQDVVYYWFEILSNFGGMFGVLIGLSFISLMEIFVFAAQKTVIGLYSMAGKE